MPVDNTFRQDIMADLPSLDWLTEADATQQTVLQGDVYESLLDADPDTNETLPLLAKSWEVSKDGLSFTFTIDENAKWFDGQPVTSQDVAFTFDTIFDPKVNSAPMKAFYGTLDPKVQLIDDHKLVVHAKTRHFNNLIMAGGIPILPKHFLQGEDMNKGKILTQTFGSGPYMLDKWNKGNDIVLKRNPNYWGMNLKQNKGGYNFEKKLYRVVREPKIGIELLKQGLFSVYGFTAEQWEQDAKNEKIQQYYETYTYTNQAPKGYSFIAWNNKLELFSDKNVRVAMSYLLNRPFMIEKFFYGHALPAIGPISSTSVYAPKDIKPIPYDPAQAVKLLNAAGWTDSNKDGVLDKGGKKLEFSLMFANPDDEKWLTVYKEDLGKVGVIMDLKRVDWNTFTKLLDDKKFEAARLGWTENVDPDLYQIWHSDSIKGNGSNFVSYSNAKVDKLILQAQKEFDKQKRIVLNQEIARIIAADAPYTFFVERPMGFVAARRGITRPKDYFGYILGTKYWAPAKKQE
jgi:peptide/nickel transport system substrate-binding protein/microcin C transport system substrate-binding protein